MPDDLSFDTARAAHAAFREAEIARYLAVVDWAGGHEVDEDGEGCLASVFNPSGRVRRLGGVGCPGVGEYELWGLGAALGVSSATVVTQISEYCEIAYRLPRLHARVVAGQVTLWRACRIARSTMSLPEAGALWVDASVAWCAERASWAALERLVEAARAEFDPPAAAESAAAAAEARRVDIDLTHPGHELDGVVEIHGLLDYADGADLDAALDQRADQLRRLGATETHDVLRSAALGDLARQQSALDLDTETSTETGPAPSVPAGRGVMIHAHLDGSDIARLDHPGGRLTMIEDIKSWCGTATKVTIRPVIDLRQPIATASYAIPDAIREHIELRYPVCAFPHCARRATSCDLDHRRPWPTGPTSSENLAPLCRRHHLLKTHGGWRYQLIPPDPDHDPDHDDEVLEGPATPQWLWFSPTGRTYLTPV